MDASEHSAPRAETSSPHLPYELAAGLIRLDHRRCVMAVALLAAPNLLAALTTRPDSVDPLTVPFVRTLLSVIITLVIGGGWIQRLRRTGNAPLFRDYVGATGAAFVLSQAPGLPLLAPFLPVPPAAQLLIFLVALPTLVFAWCYYLLPAALLLGVRPLGEAARFSRAFTLADPWLPLRILLPAVGLKILLVGLVSAADPDGRHAVTALGIGLGSGAGTLLATYLTLGFIIARLPERTWSELGLDPYRQARTTTLVVHSRPWLARRLNLRAATLTCAIGALIWGANAIRLSELPPAAEISPRRLTIAGSSVRVVLDVTDSTYRFRGFQPIFFSLAGESGFALARFPQSVTTPGAANELLLGVPRDRDTLPLELVFTTNRSAAELAQAEDLYLWYRRARIVRLDMKRAAIEDSDGASAESAPPAPSRP